MTDREKIQAEIEDKLAQGEATIEKLKARMKEVDEDASEEIAGAITAAERVVEKGRSKLGQLAEATDDQFDELWADVKEGWNDVANDLEHGWKSLSDRVKSFLT